MDLVVFLFSNLNTPFLFPILKTHTKKKKQKKKGGRSFQSTHRRNIMRGQHEKEVTERKRKQEEQGESEL